MVDIGIAPSTTETARLVVDEIDGSLAVIGAGTLGGPSRRVDIFEDVRVRGNLQSGEVYGTRFRLDQGVDGTLTAGVDDEVPRLEKLGGDEKLHIVGGGPLFGPNRTVTIHDDLQIIDDLSIGSDLSIIGTGTAQTNFNVVNDLAVGNDVTVTGEVSANVMTSTGIVSAGEVGSWSQLKAENAVYAAGTFHVYNRGSGTVARLICGFGWDDTDPILIAGPRVDGPTISYQFPSLILTQSIYNPTMTITPWLVGEYDESLTAQPPLLLSATSNPLLTHIVPMSLVRGPVGGLSGATPGSDFCVQQVDVAFFDTGGNSFVSLADDGGGQPADLVFDVTIVGAECLA